MSKHRTKGRSRAAIKRRKAVDELRWQLAMSEGKAANAASQLMVVTRRMHEAEVRLGNLVRVRPAYYGGESRCHVLEVAFDIDVLRQAVNPLGIVLNEVECAFERNPSTRWILEETPCRKPTSSRGFGIAGRRCMA